MESGLTPILTPFETENMQRCEYLTEGREDAPAGRPGHSDLMNLLEIDIYGRKKIFLDIGFKRQIYVF